MNLKFWKKKEYAEIKKEESIKKTLQKIDKGLYLVTGAEKKLLDLKEGKKLKTTLYHCTICPVGNVSCNDMMVIDILGLNLAKKEDCYKHFKLQICSLGVKKDNDCPLSK